MKSRAGLVAGVLLGAVLGVAVGLTWGVQSESTWAMWALPISLAAAFGVLMGAVGQVAQWVRAAAGSAKRLEYAQARSADDAKALRRKLDDVAVKVTRTERDLHRRTDTLTQQITRLTDQLARQREEIAGLRSATRQSVDDQMALVEAHSQLQRLVPLDQAMPRPGTWAASEDLLLWLVSHVLSQQPRLIVDLGSGQSSVWMAAALRRSGAPGRVVAIDHDPEYAAATRALAAHHGVSRWLEVRVAPLIDVVVAGRPCRWYDPEVFTDLRDIDLVSVDGPPGQGVTQARWPALPFLDSRLSARATVVMDDMIRTDEQDIVDDWLATYPQWQVQRLDFEKGAAVLTCGEANQI